MREKIHEIVKEAIADMNEMLDDDEKFQYEDDARLFGVEGGIDSFSLVSLIANIEERVMDEFGVEIFLVTDADDMLNRYPFASIATLEQYVEELVSKEQRR